MTPDTTALSYWLNWRFLLCATWILNAMVCPALLIWRYEGNKNKKNGTSGETRESAGCSYEGEAWGTCLKTIHPIWLLGYRIVAFCSMLALLLADSIIQSARIFYFYTHAFGSWMGIPMGGDSVCNEVTESTDFNELVNKEPCLLSTKLVVKPDMLFGKRGKSGLVALNLDLAGVSSFVKEKLGKEVEMGGCKGPITTFIVEPFVPHNEEFYVNIVSQRLSCSISFSECGGIEIEENWEKVKTIFVSTGISFTSELCAPLVATLPLEIKGVIEEFIKVVYALFLDYIVQMGKYRISNALWKSYESYRKLYPWT